MIRKLRLKFVGINMVIVTVMLAVILSLVLTSTYRSMEQEGFQALQKAGGPEIRLPWFALEIGPQGSLAVTGSDYYDLTDKDFLQEVLSLAQDQQGTLREYALRYAWMGGPRGERLVFVDMTGDIQTMQTMVRSSILIGIVSFGLFLIISIFLARWAVKPVETAWNQQRQFVADASHELKTPLTVILTNTELLREEFPQEEKLRSIQTMSRQMRGLVESLLELARVDNGAAKMEFTQLDMSALVEEGLLPFEPVYFENGLLLESRIQPGLRVWGSQRHLQQVLDVLLDNACKYAQPETSVQVQLTGQGKTATLTVANVGQPMSRQELKDIFKRFYRADKTRAIDGSYGLGLPIAEAVVREHGGRIWAESQNGWNCFFVQLPIV